MKTLSLPSNVSLSVLGLGTWRMGESGRSRGAEIGAIRMALELGYRLFDTAEMYGDGGAEEVLGQALEAAFRGSVLTRDQVFVVSKVYPQNASASGIAAACERSCRRLRLDHIDLYLLHWRGAHPLADTIAGFEAMQARAASVIGA